MNDEKDPRIIALEDQFDAHVNAINELIGNRLIEMGATISQGDGTPLATFLEHWFEAPARFGCRAAHSVGTTVFGHAYMPGRLYCEPCLDRLDALLRALGQSEFRCDVCNEHDDECRPMNILHAPLVVCLQVCTDCYEEYGPQ